MNKWVLSEEHRKTVQLYWQSECGQSFYMTARFGTVTTRLYNIGTYYDICIYSGLWHPDSGMRNRQHCRLSICVLVEFVIYWIRSKFKQKSDDEKDTSVICKLRPAFRACCYYSIAVVFCNNGLTVSPCRPAVVPLLWTVSCNPRPSAMTLTLTLSGALTLNSKTRVTNQWASLHDPCRSSPSSSTPSSWIWPPDWTLTSFPLHDLTDKSEHVWLLSAEETQSPKVA